jgi:hypothetical protein
MTELDRYTIAVTQRAMKKKARKVRFPAIQDEERVVYCCRCLKGSYEVELMVYDPFFSLCSECIENLATFLEHLRDAKKQRHTPTQSEADESEGSCDR